jgi:hypothetical protein
LGFLNLNPARFGPLDEVDLRTDQECKALRVEHDLDTVGIELSVSGPAPVALRIMPYSSIGVLLWV